MTHDEARALLERQFADGPLAPAHDAALRTHLRGCAACRALYDRLAELEEALEGTTPPEVPRAQVRRLLASGPPGVRRSLRPRMALLAALLLVGAALALLARRPAEPAFQARGGAAEGAQAWIRIFRLEGGVAKPLGETLAPGDGLLFAYSNLAGSPWRALAIAGRDAAGRAHWYHPAWTDPAADPESLPIEAGALDVELPEAVHADHAPGPLKICGIFSRAPLRVRAVDAALEAEGRWPHDAHVDCLTVEVQR